MHSHLQGLNSLLTERRVYNLICRYTTLFASIRLYFQCTSDPVARTTSTGENVFGGHIGTIYQASNALYLGRATPRTLTVLPNGQVFNDRAMQKVRGQEQGADYGERQLVECGARSRAVGEDPRLWLRQALKEIGVRQIRHPGNHRYAFRIGRRRKSIRIGLIPYSYPKMMN